MKKLFLLALIILSSCIINGQTDEHGNPVFNSSILKEEAVNGLTIISSYYTLKNNIENKESSVYINDNPGLDDISSVAAQLPADFFVVAKDQHALAMFMVQLYPAKQIMLLYPATMQSKLIPFTLKGDITQSRAEELIKEKYDPAAYIKGTTLFFNKRSYEIMPSEKIKQTILGLIESEKVSTAKPSDMQIMTQAETRKYIIEQTTEGGKLDFFTPIKGKEYDAVQIKPGVFTTNTSVALYSWGRAAYELGIHEIENALSLYSEINGRALNKREEEYIKNGFNKTWEKE